MLHLSGFSFSSRRTAAQTDRLAGIFTPKQVTFPELFSVFRKIF